MKRFFKFLIWGILALVCIFLILVGGIYYRDTRPTIHPSLNSKAPQYVLRPINYTQKKIKLSRLNGKVVVLFWYSRCLGAKIQLAEVGRLAKKFKDQVQIFVIYEDGDEQLIRKLQHQYKNIIECENNIYVRERIFPHSSGFHYVIIDQNGIIKAYGSQLHVMGITEAVVNKAKFSPKIEDNILLGEVFYKMWNNDLKNGELLIFYKIEGDVQEGLRFPAGNFYQVAVNVSGWKLYEATVNLKKIKDSLKLKELLKDRYVFAYRIDHTKYGDDASTYKLFRKRAQAKLDSIFKVKSHFVYNEDSTVAKLEIEELDH